MIISHCFHFVKRTRKKVRILAIYSNVFLDFLCIFHINFDSILNKNGKNPKMLRPPPRFSADKVLAFSGRQRPRFDKIVPNVLHKC